MGMLFVTIVIALVMVGGYYYFMLRHENRETPRDREIERQNENREHTVGPRL